MLHTGDAMIKKTNWVFEYLCLERYNLCSLII